MSSSESDQDSYFIELFAQDFAALVGVLDHEIPVICGLPAGDCISL